jgi:hypothetical protein
LTALTGEIEHALKATRCKVTRPLPEASSGAIYGVQAHFANGVRQRSSDSSANATHFLWLANVQEQRENCRCGPRTVKRKHGDLDGIVSDVGIFLDRFENLPQAPPRLLLCQIGPVVAYDTSGYRRENAEVAMIDRFISLSFSGSRFDLSGLCKGGSPIFENRLDSSIGTGSTFERTGRPGAERPNPGGSVHIFLALLCCCAELWFIEL